jgi:Flp pilus assembly protein TadD
VAHYRSAYQVEPSATNLLRLHGLLTRLDPADSIRLLRTHLRKEPKAHAVRRALADAEARSGDFAAARRSYEQLDRDAAPDAEVLNNLAQVMLLQRDPAALAVAERALKLRPSAAHIIGTAGWAAFQAGQVDRAITLLRDARLRDPGHPSTRFYLGSALAKAGRNAEARAELQAALELDAGFAQAAQARDLLAGLP